MFNVDQPARVRRSASMITCRMLETERLTWAKYRLFSRGMYQHREKHSYFSSVYDGNLLQQLIVEAECQRKFAEHIHETEGILATIYGYSSFWTGFDTRGHQAVRGNQPNAANRQISAYKSKFINIIAVLHSSIGVHQPENDVPVGPFICLHSAGFRDIASAFGGLDVPPLLELRATKQAHNFSPRFESPSPTDEEDSDGYEDFWC
ncbi:hypothetical protein FB451DRAFT_1165885 [Mycena latifolia]|nr:hypothetical protein FB451DRAFT_1165885 [Mycena latifolia]